MDSKYVKYPRTYHLPWSNPLSDDKTLTDDSCFIGKKVVVSLKMDGENTTMYNDHIHARSLTSVSHPSRDYVKGIWSKISYLLDNSMRICGENMYACHTIEYNNLDSYFLMFSIWIEDKCLSWNQTVEYAKILGLKTVPVIFEGTYNKEKIISLFKEYSSTNEGYIVRLEEEFKYEDFKKSVAKYVKPEFKELNDKKQNWFSNQIKTNKLKSC
jgi:hypothetical protein